MALYSYLKNLDNYSDFGNNSKQKYFYRDFID